MNLPSELQKYGIVRESVKTFGGLQAPDMLDYIDLVERPNAAAPRLDGVAESQGRPLLFYVDENRLAIPAEDQRVQLREIRRSLACRGARTYLARVLPGRLCVVPVSLEYKIPDWKMYLAGTREASSFFSRLGLGQYDGPGEPSKSDQVFKEMFDLLKEGAERLANHIDRSDVLSLVGRALFFRFLQDRQIISDRNLDQIAPGASTLKDCFDTVENSAATCRWLDRTFNGDFLRLSAGGGIDFFDGAGRRTKGEVFDVLGAILRSDQPVGDRHYQGKFNWGTFDFAHVPVGLLSQVYEKFVWTWAVEEARASSVHYTPRNIAATLVGEAFDNLPNAHEARVLDPACGAGVFLVLAFRRIYRERWTATERRPDTRAIRAILDKQLTGFDISDSALKMSALSLYLTAIELDPDPVPPEKLRFSNLRESVLFNCRPPGTPETGVSVGSLGSHLGVRFDGKFDLVIGNPPWTSLPKDTTGNQVASDFTTISKDVIRRRGGADFADDYQNPDSAPDLPFVWKSTEWCRPDGRIAMALPARILLKQEPVPARARNTMLELLEVNGIINGSNLSDTNVWPDMQQPFILLFARNCRPKPGHAIRFITPQYDSDLNRRGEVRIDSKSAQPVDLAATREFPWIWKALAVGTSLDVDVIRKLNAAAGRPLKAYWEELKLISGNGYQIKRNQRQQDASKLFDLLDLDNTALFPFVVEPEHLRRFAHPTAFRPRDRALYDGPLVLVKESPGDDRTKGWALLSNADVAFNESFHGYSTARHSDGDFLARYLHLFVHTQLRMHYALLTSPKFGAERRKVYKSDLDDFPFVPISSLTGNQRQKVISLSNRLERSDITVFHDLDMFFGSLYGLDAFDVEVIQDTMAVCLPYKESRERACQPPSILQYEGFRERLISLLAPFFKVLGLQLEVTLMDSGAQYRDPFRVLTLSIGGKRHLPDGNDLEKRVLQLASETGATQVFLETERGLNIGIINQYRYWTPSRARLLAATILEDHASLFEEV